MISGQNDIKKLRQENFQLRRAIWSLRDEHDRLGKLLKNRNRDKNCGSDLDLDEHYCSDCDDDCDDDCDFECDEDYRCCSCMFNDVNFMLIILVFSFYCV